MSLLPYQQDVLRWLQDHNGIILVHTIGSRRTLTAIAIAEDFLAKHPEQKVRVFAPVVLLEHFQTEMERAGVPDKDKQYSFTSLEYVLGKASMQAICSKGDLLIIDDAHILRTRAYALPFLQCAKRSSKVVLMTATPFVDHTRDIVPLVALAKQTEPLSDSDWGAMLEDPSAFAQYLSNVFHFYRVAKTAMNHFPTVKIEEKKLEMESSFYTAYLKVEETNADMLRKFQDNKATSSFLLDLQEELSKTADEAKIKFTQTKIKNLKGRKKLVVLGNLQSATVGELYKWLKEKGIDYTTLGPSMSTRRLEKNIDLYNQDQLKVLFLSIQMTVSVSLFDTSELIVLDVPSNATTLNRAIDSIAHYKSHDKLSYLNRNVIVYLLYTTKPPDTNWNKIREFLKKRTIEQPILSLDLLLKKMIDAKSAIEEKFIQKLERLQIKFPKRRTSSTSKSIASFLNAPKTK